MSIVEAVVLGLVQGLTEFIPISSTAHLEIVPVLLGWGDPGAAASAVIQFGTWIAALIYFARDIVRLVGGFFRGLVTRRFLEDTDSREAWLVIIGTIPIVVLGLLLKKHIESTFRGLWIITIMVIVVAILLQIAEWHAKRHQLRTFEQLTVTDAVAIGFGQCLALIPSSSRSGSVSGSFSSTAVPTKRSSWLPLETLASSSSCRYLRAWRTTAFGTPARPATWRP